MCVLLERITVAKKAVRHLNVGAKDMMFYAGVIIQSGQYQVFTSNTI